MIWNVARAVNEAVGNPDVGERITTGCGRVNALPVAAPDANSAPTSSTTNRGGRLQANALLPTSEILRPPEIGRAGL